MEFDETVTAIAFVGILALATLGMFMTPMDTNTILMMVVPSMVVGAAVFLYIGMQFGAYRATQ